MPEEATDTQENTETEVKVDTAAIEAASQVESAASSAIAAKLKALNLPNEDEEAQETPSETETESGEGEEAGEEAEDGEAEGEDAETPDEKTSALDLDANELQMARQLGLTKEDLSEIGAKSARTLLARAGPKLRQKWADLGSIEQRLKGKAEEQADEDEESPASLPDDFEVKGDDLYELDDEGKVPAIDKFKQLIKVVKSQGQELAELRGKDRKQREQQVKATVDEFFGGLNLKTYPQFGKGELDRLDEKSDEAQARIELMDKAAQIRRGADRDGVYMPLKQSLAEALLIVAAGEERKAARNELAEETRRRSKQRIGRPSGRHKVGAAPTAEQHAAQAIKDRARELSVKLQEDEA